jgi:hypothetical protein
VQLVEILQDCPLGGFEAYQVWYASESPAVTVCFTALWLTTSL